MKLAISFLLLITLALGCQKSNPQSDSEEYADVPNAREVVTILEQTKLADPPSRHDAEVIQQVAKNFLVVSDRDSQEYEFLRKEGIPLLLPHYDRMLPFAEDFYVRMAVEEMLTVFCFYQTQESIDRIVHTTKQDFMILSWSDCLWQFQPGTPGYDNFWSTMFREWPQNEVVGKALITIANSHALDEQIPDHRHPFDSSEGMERLRAYLKTSERIADGYFKNSWDINGKNPSIESARLAAEALSFVESQQREELLELAREHPIQIVQMEAASVSAKLGQQSGIDELVQRTHDPSLSLTAQKYLIDVDRADLIPEACKEEEFLLRAFCAQQLAWSFFKPGKIESIEVLDRRNLLWPVDWSEVVLISYRINFQDGDKKWDVEDVGYFSGDYFQSSSKALSLFWDESAGDSLSEYAPEEIYGFYVVHLLLQTHISNDELALVESYADGDAKLHGPEQLPDGAATLVGRAAIDLKVSGYPTVKAAIFDTSQDGNKGWTVLEDGQTTHYAKADLPESATAKRVLRMHVGRSYLSLLSEK